VSFYRWDTRSSWLTGQLPFSALTISCLGGSFSGIGVHEFRLTTAEKTEGLKVCKANDFSATRPDRNLTCVVLLFLRGLLLRSHYSYQVEHFIHADAHCVREESFHAQSLRRLCHVHTHEPHRLILHHFPLQSCSASAPYLALTLLYLTMYMKIRMGHCHRGW
jgi:hypothetical protein